MARPAKPWFWKARKAWFVTLDGTRHRLHPERKAAFEKFHQMMAQPALRQTDGSLLISLFDTYLAWAKQHRSEATYHWYRQFLQSFIETIPTTLTAEQLKPFHVQRWVDSTPENTNNGKRAKIRAVQRALRWARQQGYIDVDPLATIEKPPAGRRERTISNDEYQRILAACPDEAFRELLVVAWETGARPQELTALEARHVDFKNARWVFPRAEAKGKRRPRIVYMSETAEAIVRRLVQQFPEGRLFRNTDGTPWKKDAINCRFSRLKKKLDTKYCLYHFRHSFATRKLQSGLDALTVAELLGHADPSMLARVYQHLSHDPQFMLRQLRQSAG